MLPGGGCGEGHRDGLGRVSWPRGAQLQVSDGTEVPGLRALIWGWSLQKSPEGSDLGMESAEIPRLGLVRQMAPAGLSMSYGSRGGEMRELLSTLAPSSRRTFQCPRPCLGGWGVLPHPA